MYKDLEKVFDTLDNLKRLGHLKNFEYTLIIEYINNLNSVVKETIENNFKLKEDIIKLNAQIEVYKGIITHEKDIFSSDE